MITQTFIFCLTNRFDLRMNLIKQKEWDNKNIDQNSRKSNISDNAKM